MTRGEAWQRCHERACTSAPTALSAHHQAARTLASAEDAAAHAQLDANDPPGARIVFQGLRGDWTFQRRINSRLASSPSGVVTGTASFTPLSATAGAAMSAGGNTQAAGGAAGEAPASRPPPPPPEHLTYLYGEQGSFTIDCGPTMRVHRGYVYVYDEGADRIDVYFEQDGARGGFFHSLRFLPELPGAGASPEAAGAGAEAAGAGPAGAGAVPSGSLGGCCEAGKAREAGASSSGSTGGPAAAAAATAANASSIRGVGTETARAGETEAAGREGGGGAGDGVRRSSWPGGSRTLRAVGDHLCIRDMYEASYRFAFRGGELAELEIEFVVRGPQKDYTATAIYARPQAGMG